MSALQFLEGRFYPLGDIGKLTLVGVVAYNLQ